MGRRLWTVEGEEEGKRRAAAEVEIRGHPITRRRRYKRGEEEVGKNDKQKGVEGEEGKRRTEEV